MIQYNPNALYSFKDRYTMDKEIQMKRVNIDSKGRKSVTTFYAERTSDSSIILVPSLILKDLVEDNSRPCAGFSGKIKVGDYFMGKVKVELYDAHQIHSNVGYVRVRVK